MERVILFVNHVLLHEPQALARLKRQQGRTLSLKWHDWHWRVRITPAGLLENDQVSQGHAVDHDLPHALLIKAI
jgi:ubiquinone biosynthesis protein UbiJ